MGADWGRYFLFCLALSCFWNNHALATKLDSSQWTAYLITGRPMPPSNFRVETSLQPPTNAAPAAGSLTNLIDNNPATFVTLTNIAASATPSALLIDLGQTCAVHRVVLNGTNNDLRLWPHTYENQTNPPLGLIVGYVGLTPLSMTNVGSLTIPYDAGNPVDTEVDLRFSPVLGRYVKLELQTQVSWGVQQWPGWQVGPPAQVVDTAWNLAEVEVHGCAGTNALAKINAVVLPSGAADPLVLAANELSYYLGELTGQPYPIITPDQTNLYSGTIYRIVDLAPLAPDYGTMTNNIAAGLLPDGVNVELQGHEVVFRAWPYRCVLWSVWEFLERQGIRWLYPEGHGDFVPFNTSVNLNILPLRFKPSAQSIYANWDTTSLQPWPVWVKQSLRQSYLYPWRNRWNLSWNGYGPLGGQEIPALPKPSVVLSNDYTEGFVGYPHNFNSVLPNRILQQHPNWWGYNANLGIRVNPTNQGATTFSMDDPEVINWVAAKVTAVAGASPPETSFPLDLSHFRSAYNLLPMDAATFCECTNWCLPDAGPVQLHSVPWVTLYDHSFSGEYYNFVNAVAGLVKQSGSPATIGALAYADVFEAPLNIPVFSNNVQVEVCFYGSPNLRMNSAPNSGMDQAMRTWIGKCRRVATYDYALLHTDFWQTNASLPVPLVSGTVDRALYLAALGTLNGGCQATPQSLAYNPWNFYAYPRIRWNTNQTSARILNEFFTGFYNEASGPMLAYYNVLEQYQLSNNINLHYRGSCYNITPGSFPLPILSLMQTNLQAAEAASTNWVVINRVKKVREGFNWVLSQRGLTAANLNDFSRYTTVPTNGPFQVSLSQMQTPPNLPWGNYASLSSSGQWIFGAQSQIQMSLNFTNPGNYQVTVNASAVPYQNVYPILNVYTGPRESTFTISSTNALNYSASFALPSGVWDLVLTYDNAAEGGRRNIIINSITITPQ